MSSFLRIFLIVMALILKAGAQEISLFNGKDLTGWSGRSEFWSVQDGAITAKMTKENQSKNFTSLVWKGGEVSDFEFSCEFRIIPTDTPGLRCGGIQFRGKVVNASEFTVSGYNVDMDYGNSYTGKLVWKMASRSCGNGVLRGQKVIITDDAKAKSLKFDVTGKLGPDAEFRKAAKRDDWNECKIIAIGDHLQIFIAGVQTVDAIDQSGVEPKSGVLALSLFYGPLATFQFRNLTLKKLGESAVVAATAVRVYTDKSGQTFRATLVSVQESAAAQEVTLKGEDGRVVTVKLSDLCQSDVTYLRKVASQAATK